MKFTAQSVRSGVSATAKVSSALALAASVALGITGCASSDSDTESMLSPDKIGTWRLTSLASGANKVLCPGTGTLVGSRTFTCAADSKLTLKSDGSFVENFSSPTGSTGHWFATGTHLMMDDDQGEDNPAVYTAVLVGNVLTLKTFEGVFVAEYTREGAASTLTHQDIVNANPALAFDKLLDAGLVGKWQYKSITYAGAVTQCPGDTGVPGIKCGSNEVMDFTSDNKFADTVSSNSHDAGSWYAYRGRIYMDDAEFNDHDPVAWTYSIQGDTLTMKKWGGVFAVSATRVK